MIDRAHPLPVVRQVKLVGISRSSAYYAPSPVSAADLALMRRIDELHLEHPFAGTRMLMRLLKREGIAIGRKCIGSLSSLTTAKRYPDRGSSLYAPLVC
jgi:putative transposase